MVLFSVLLLTLLVHSEKKDLSTPFLQHQLEMQLSRPKIQHLAFSKFIELISLYLGPLIQRFLKTLM